MWYTADDTADDMAAIEIAMSLCKILKLVVYFNSNYYCGLQFKTMC
jgi:hypothetical protein